MRMEMSAHKWRTQGYHSNTSTKQRENTKTVTSDEHTK